MSLTKYQKMVKRQDKVTSELFAAYEKQISGVMEDLLKTIDSKRMSDGKLAQSAASARFVKGLLRKANPLAKKLDTFLLDSGAAASVATLDLPFGEELTTLSKKEMKAVLKSTSTSLTKGMLKVSNNLEKRLKQELLTLSLTPKSPETSARVLQEAIGGPISQARTLMQTSLASVQRDVHRDTMNSLPKDEQAMLYIGPSDGATRPFCSHLTGKVIKKSDLSKLKNGQSGASKFSQYGGGWNCRHRLMPITLSFAKDQGMTIASASDIARANGAAKR